MEITRESGIGNMRMSSDRPKLCETRVCQSNTLMDKRNDARAYPVPRADSQNKHPATLLLMEHSSDEITRTGRCCLCSLSSEVWFGLTPGVLCWNCCRMQTPAGKGVEIYSWLREDRRSAACGRPAYANNSIVRA